MMPRPYHLSAEGRAALSARMKALHADPEFRARRVKTCVYCGRRGYRMEPDGDGIFACADTEACEARIDERAKSR